MSAQKQEVSVLLEKISQKLKSRKQFVATAESCTGGGIATAMTDLPGSSQWFDCGFVTYSNESKVAMLGMSLGVIVVNGAVSEETVNAMAMGALSKSKATITVAVSGVAGPSGGNSKKPVGTVWFAWAGKGGYLESEMLHFQGDRAEVRQQTIVRALQGIEFYLNKK